jgi:hypothetical protein
VGSWYFWKPVACGGVQPDESVEESGPETGTAESALKGHGPADENNGFPRYYEDTAGLAFSPIDGGDTNCILGDWPACSTTRSRR